MAYIILVLSSRYLQLRLQLIVHAGFPVSSWHTAKPIESYDLDKLQRMNKQGNEQSSYQPRSETNEAGQEYVHTMSNLARSYGRRLQQTIITRLGSLCRIIW